MFVVINWILKRNVRLVRYNYLKDIPAYIIICIYMYMITIFMNA